MSSAGEQDRLQAAEALAKALANPDWGTRTFKAGKMTYRTLAAFAPYASIPEVRQLIDAIRNRRPVDGLTLHYLKRRYVENEAINSPLDLNRWFEETLRDKTATLYKPAPGGRYVVYTEKYHRLAIINLEGRRVSVYTVYDTDVEVKGEPWCQLKELLR